METKNSLPNQVIDLSEILKGYEDKWVILSEDYKKVLKSSTKLEDLVDYSNLGIMMRVPNPDFIFTSITQIEIPL